MTQPLYYPNPDYARRRPPGERGTVRIGCKIVDAVRVSSGTAAGVWLRMGASSDWARALSTLTRDTFQGLPGLNPPIAPAVRRS